jgi:DNA-binding CsgD family transcriptional regulator
MLSDVGTGEDFVGRQRELERLRVKLTAAGTGRGSLVLITGEAGVGKSSLVQQFLKAARAEGATALWGACFEGEWRPPYAPWSEALGQLAASLEPEQLQRYLGAGAPPLAQLIPQIRVQLPAIPPAAPLSPNEERYRLYEAIGQFLSSITAEQPVVLALDDLHWADRDSLEVFRYVARFTRRCPLLLIGIYREPDLDAGRHVALSDILAALQREAGPERLPLRGFNLSEVHSYLRQAAEQALPQALIQTIHHQTSGNPFYIRELFRHLVEEAKIEQRAGRWTTDFSLSELGIPPGVRQVVARRMARLAPETNTMLRVAAAFTGGFGFYMLPPLTDLPEETLLNSLDEALQAGLIRTLGGRSPRYDFAHAIVRHTLYENMNPDRRARLHRRIAQVLEQVTLDQPEIDQPELAFQYHASAALPGAERGIPFCLAAAERASSSYAYDQVVTFLRMARDLANNSAPLLRAEISSKLAVAEAHALLLNEAQQTGEETLALMIEAKVQPDAMITFLAVTAQALKEGGAPLQAWEPLVEQGLALAGKGRDLLWARLMLLRGRIEPVASKGLYINRWLGYDAQAVAIARTQGDEDDYARTLEPLDWRTPEETAAVVDLARRWQSPTAVLRALDVAGRDLIFRHGDMIKAREIFIELLAAGERYGSIPAQAEALVQLSLCYTLLGEIELARQIFERAGEWVARLGAGHRLHALATMSMESVLGEYGGAEWSRLAQAFAHIATDPQTGQGVMGLTAANFAVLNHLRAGNPAEARRFLALLTPVLERLPWTTYLYNGGIDRAGTAVWELAAVEYAGVYRRLALELLAAGLEGSPYSSNALTVARMAALAGELAEASSYFTRARQVAEAAGQRPLRAIVDYDEALALVRNHSLDRSSIETLLNLALAQFRALGMAPWEQRTLALQAQITSSLPVQSPLSTGYPGNLTTREVEVLRLIGSGATNKEIATHLVISIATAERHVANIYTKIGVRNRAEATLFALQHGLVQSD